MKDKTWDKIGTITYYMAFVAQSAFIVCAFIAGRYGEAAWASAATLWMHTWHGEAKSCEAWKKDARCESYRASMLAETVMREREKYGSLLAKHNALLAQKTAVVKAEGGAQ